MDSANGSRWALGGDALATKCSPEGVQWRRLNQLHVVTLGISVCLVTRDS